jgi:polyphosphate kinase
MPKSAKKSRRRLPTPAPRPVDDHETFFNREVSWLAFNARVLEEAIDPRTPLLERLRFLSIFHTNLDEFFMIRVSGLLQQVDAGVEVLSLDGQSARSQIAMIRERLGPMVARAASLLDEELRPALSEHGLEVVHYDMLTPDERAHWDRWFEERVLPILTPLAVSSTHPFPFISNLSLNLALMVQAPSGESRLARVKVPLQNLPRFLPLSGAWTGTVPERFLPLEELIAANLDSLFPGMEVGRPWQFRVTRDADVDIAVDEANDLLQVLQQELRKRRFGEAVRLQVAAGMPADIVEGLRTGLHLEPEQVEPVAGMLTLHGVGQLLKADLPGQKYPGFVSKTPAALENTDPFTAIRQGDILLHHPFQSMMPVVDFIRAAARDPAVVAIKQSLYRTNKDSPIIAALQEAVERGKQVAAVVELKARFDEENNIVWAQRLEEAGVHVVYGVPLLKTHAKLALVVRRNEMGQLIRYAHIGTGNYNTLTARIYTDLGLLTADPEITADVGDVFNHLTGFAHPSGYRRLLVAPRFMKRGLIARIERERENAAAGRPARIIAKCNAVADADVIRALYRASGAGVEIDLLVRGICCLRPGLPGVSENITVRSVVGRFLEHTRVYWFANDDDPEVFMGSADWMDRNLDRRVEVLAPVDAPDLKAWLRDVLLQRYLDDMQRTRIMQPDGTYIRREGVGPDVHQQFLADP